MSYRNSLDRHASLAMTKSPVIVNRHALLAMTNSAVIVDREASLAVTNFPVIASKAWQSKIELEPNLTDLPARHDAT